jgi:hypothetical protein
LGEPVEVGEPVEPPILTGLAKWANSGFAVAEFAKIQREGAEFLRIQLQIACIATLRCLPMSRTLEKHRGRSECEFFRKLPAVGC